MSRAAALLAALLGGSAAAAQDARITTHFYDASEVVALHGRIGIQSTIAFAPDEHIENIAVGDSAAWQVTPNKRADLLFLKPMVPRARTNMTVVTDSRTYLFDLIGSATGAPVYMLRFTYPAPPKIAPKPQTAATTPPPPAASAPATAPPAAPPPAAAAIDFAWTMHGDRRLLPARAFDDGRMTYLSWPQDVALPAILMRDAAGAEGPVNYTVAGDYVVIDGVPPLIVLRVGKQTATLVPMRHAAAPAAPPPPVAGDPPPRAASAP